MIFLVRPNRSYHANDARGAQAAHKLVLEKR